METILDVESLKVKLSLIFIGLGFIYSAIYLFLAMMVPYNLTIRKQKDVFFRRFLFFVGIFSLVSAHMFFTGNYLIASWEPNWDPNDAQAMKDELRNFILFGTLISLLIYILTFWLSAKFLRGLIGYKPWTVFVSKGKKFGLF